LTKVLQFAILSVELKLGFFILKIRIRRVVMRNFIIVAVFVAILAFETTGYSEKSEEAAGKTVSFEEFQTQHEEIMSMISSGGVSSKELEKTLEEDLEVIKEVNRLQNARIEEMLREMNEGSKELREALDRYTVD